jgi:short-subunit dehydrogenase
LKKYALIIGNSDGIGLGLTRELLQQDWIVTGISKSPSPLGEPGYEHVIADVQSIEYSIIIKKIMQKHHPLDLCVYCAGIGELLDLSDMTGDAMIVDVNLLGMVKLASHVIPQMVKSGKGHFIGLSSVADAMLSEEAPSYHASKAGFSNYLESLALATRPYGVSVSNVRFGFVDTKMAKGEVKPLMMTVEAAVTQIIRCIRKKPVRMTRPRIAIPLVAFRNRMLRLRNFKF